MENTTYTGSSIINCECCAAIVNASDSYCQKCGFPLMGTEQEKNTFKAKYIIDINDQEDLKKQIKNARTSLIVVAVLTILGGFVEAARGEKEDTGMIVLIAVILAAIYGGFAIWSNKKPFAALLSGLILFISIILISAFLEPMSIISGIIVKVLVIGYLIKGIVGASKVRNVEYGE